MKHNQSNFDPHLAFEFIKNVTGKPKPERYVLQCIVSGAKEHIDPDEDLVTETTRLAYRLAFDQASFTSEELTNLLVSERDWRKVHPLGYFDNAGRWYPDAEEDPTGRIHKLCRPSRSYPYRYNRACRTTKHCKELIEYRLENNIPVFNLFEKMFTQ